MNVISAPGVLRSTPSLAPAIQSSLTVDPQRQPSIAQDNPVSLDNPAALKTAFGDSCNWKTLTQKLQAVLESLSQRFAQGAYPDATSFAADLALSLNRISIPVCEDSTYYRQHALTPQSLVSLQSYLQGCGLSVPTTWAELVDLNQRITLRAQVHPLGNFSGALAWPIPLGNEDQRAIIALMQSASSGLPGLPLVDESKGTLGYLFTDSSVSDADLRAPTLAIEKLLGSPKAQALGQAIQTALGGFATDRSLNEYLLAAIQLGLDPESCQAPERNHVAGFDLAQPAQWGQRPSTVIEGLRRHLLDKGRVTEQTALLGARLVLAKSAPQFLVKDIPPGVTYGSLAWTQLTIATARIEADSPGRALNLSYAQALASAEQVDTPQPLLQDIQKKAMTDWALANGLLSSATPTDAELEPVRLEYNRQLLALTTASSLAKTPIPSRREMALDALKAAFPNLDPALFEVKRVVGVFQIPGRAGKVDGPRSMLDIVMHGKKLGDHEHWMSADPRLPVSAFCTLRESGKLEVAENFASDYEQAITAAKKGHQGLAQALLATLPVQDRKNLEYGAVEFFHTNEYKMGFGMLVAPSETLKRRGHTLRVKTTLGGEVNIYEIDTKGGTVKKQNFLIRRYTPPYTDKKLREEDGDPIHKTVQFKPFKDEQPDLAKAQPNASTGKLTFDSARSEYIGRVFAESLDLRNDDLLAQARGQTAYDNEADSLKAAGEFFLNLIPLRSAIVNFSKGDIGAGLFDLGMDFIGLVTLGAGKAAQAGKAFSKGISSLRGVSKVARFVGTTAIEAFNPLSGVGDLTVSAARFINKGGRQVLAKGRETVNQLRGASGSYDVLKAASKQHEAVATGILKVAGEPVEGAAVLHKGQWYAFDADQMRPYGGPLEGFTADTHAVDGVLGKASVEPASELSNAVSGRVKVPEATLDGLSRNSQGVYVGADGHSSYIRHTDSAGQSAVYEVRQVTRTEDGVTQARIYHNNRQTEWLVQHVEGDQWQRLGALGGVHINADHLRAWEALPIREQYTLTVAGFARRHRLNPPTLAHYVQADGRLSAAGIVLRDRAAGVPPNPITPSRIRDWQGMTQQARDATTMEGFASGHNLDIGEFKGYVRQNGDLSGSGEAFLFRAAGGTYSRIANNHLLEWSQLVQQPNNRVTPALYRRQHNLNPVDWSQWMFVDGSLKPVALKRISTLQAAPSTSVPSRKRPAAAPQDPPQQAPLDLSKPQSGTTPAAQIPGPSSSVTPIIKTEPQVRPLRTLEPHQVDNSLPILQDPLDPKVSLTQALEGPIEDIRIANWNGLLEGLDTAQKKSVGDRIKASIKDWLRTEGSHGSRFDEMLEVVTPLDDGGPARGASVWAKRDIAQFEVLGPYAGKYHASEASLLQEQRKQGSRAVLTYLFGTRSGTRTVSALNTGNTLSLVNTSQLRNGPAWQANNVVSISVGKNLTFYVSLKDIKAGDELLLDYGPFYQPVPDIAIKPDPDA